MKFIRAGKAEKIAPLADALHALYITTIDQHRYLLCGTGEETLLRDCYYIHLYRDPAKARLEAIQWRLRRERGADLYLVDGRELRRLEPAISPRFERAVVIKGQGKTVNPARLGQVLAAKFQSQGGSFLRAEVQSLTLRENGGFDLATAEGPLTCHKLVLAAGAWSARLLQGLGYRVPLETERGYHLTFRNPGIEVANTISDAERKFSANMMEMGLRLAGTVELAGLDAPPDYRRAKVLAVLGREMFPDLNTEDASQWMGHRPSLPDSLPMIGPLPGHPSLILAFGHSHLGLTGAAPTGRLVAQIAAGESPNIDISPFRADRFRAA